MKNNITSADLNTLLNFPFTNGSSRPEVFCKEAVF